MSDREVEYYDKNPNLIISFIDEYIKSLQILPHELVFYFDNYVG